MRAPAYSPLEASLVRVFDAEHQVVGAGFLVDVAAEAGLVCTCAHVVAAALGDPEQDHRPLPAVPQEVQVDFPFLHSTSIIARVVPEAWRPIGGYDGQPNDGVEDVALLRLATALPPDARPAPLGLVAVDELKGLRFQAYGFPDGTPTGVHARGELKDRRTDGTIQIEGTTVTGQRIEPGFSGSAVWCDTERPWVVGMVVSHLRNEAAKVGYMIPVAHIQRVYPALPIERYAQERLAELVRLWPLPTMASVDPFDDLSIFRSKIADQYRGNQSRPPYVRRDADDALEQVLSQQPFVLVIGPSKSGKSRTAFEVCTRLYPDSLLIVPKPPAANLGKLLTHLPELLPPESEFARPHVRAILWLDDVDQYLDAQALTTTSIDSGPLASGRMRALATIGTDERDRFYATLGETGQAVRDDITRAARDVFELAQQRQAEIRLHAESSPQEVAQATRLYPGLELDWNLGVPRTFAAVKELTEHFLNGEGSSGWAVVRAAADWQRAGARRPITKDELKQLYYDYAPSLAPGVDVTPESYEEGLKWARWRSSSSAALLTASQTDGMLTFTVFGSIVSYIEQEGEQCFSDNGVIPDKTLDFVREHVPPTSAFSVGMNAVTRGNNQAAERAMDRALKEVSPDEAPYYAPSAGTYSGMLKEERGDKKGAEEVYRQGVKRGEPEAAGKLQQLLRSMKDYFSDEAVQERNKRAKEEKEREKERERRQVERIKDIRGVMSRNRDFWEWLEDVGDYLNHHGVTPLKMYQLIRKYRRY